MDVFPKKLAVKVILTEDCYLSTFLDFFRLCCVTLCVKVPAPEAPVPVSFIKDADNEADSQRERERKRFLTNSAMGVVSTCFHHEKLTHFA